MLFHLFASSRSSSRRKLPLLKNKHPTLIVSGFERTLELNCAFKEAGTQLKTVLMCLLCQNSVSRGREELGGDVFFLHYFSEISLGAELPHLSLLH